MSLDISDMEPGDVYRDEQGNLFVVEAIWTQPVVSMVRVYPITLADGTPKKITGGVGGYMWTGFDRIAKAPVKQELDDLLSKRL